jgi:PPM family protein phosphatase
MLTLRAFGITDIGNVRRANEDSFVAQDFECGNKHNCLLIAVADGVGGANAGDIASRTAIDTIRDTLFRTQQPGKDDLQASIEDAGRKIYGMSLNEKDYNGMATTCTAMVFTEDKLILGHIGDSRAYRIRDNEIRQLTEDHTVVNDLYKSGVISEPDMEHHPHRNVLTKALGVKESVAIDIFEETVSENDVYVVCTDGLYKYVHDGEMKALVSSLLLEDTTDYLVSLAKERGGDDNISVVVVKVYSQQDGKKTARITEVYSESKNRKHTVHLIVLIGMIYVFVVYFILRGGDRIYTFFSR